MKTKKLPLAIVLAVALSINHSVIAQTSGELLEFYSNFASTKNIENGAKRNVDFQGSPYSNENFVKGKIILKSGIFYKNIPLRFNIYNKEMEFQKGNTAYAITNSEEIMSVEIGNQNYIYCSYQSKWQEDKMYFLVVENGQSKLLKMEQVEFVPEQKPGAYSEAKPAYFRKTPKLIYIKLKEKPASIVKRKKDLLKIFAGEKKAIDFIKNNKISARNIEDLKKLIIYYNSI